MSASRGTGHQSGRGQGRERSQRQLRVGEEIRHRMAEILTRDDVRDPELYGQSITVTQVQISPDMKQALVYARPLAGDVELSKKVIAALNRHAGFLRGRLGREISIRHTPELRFALDESFDKADELDRLLRSEPVARDLQK
ncbi:MAG: 30S ribosome-binding factor RbfA [Alphaproteobacteria bacterium]|nr:30S ribosome-binding factor RbfA [Alphaproteobacteria bacterium]MDP1670699.1 30S ribosome-binding factor RbfA [Alphaproteobacteria bacterium]